MMNSPRSSAPIPDDSQIPDEAVENRPIDLMEYLEGQDIPDPNFHPQVEAAPVADSCDDDECMLPPEEPPSPPTGLHHQHEVSCPLNWLPPSLKPIYRQPGRREKLQSAGILNFIAYNYPAVDEMFIDTEWRDISWSEAKRSIVVTPRLPGTDFLSEGLNPTCQRITTAYLQRLWPDLPSRDSHPFSLLGVAPDHDNPDFMTEAVGRYFALYATVDENNRYPDLSLDPCFCKPLYRFLLRLSYIFGWRGYPLTFPAKYYPMAVLTFASGGHMPWADLLLRELIDDVKHRRQCPRMLRVWKVIHESVVSGRHAPPPTSPPEKRYIYETYLKQCMMQGLPYIWYFHYHVPEISQWAPPVVRQCVERGACDQNEHLY